MAIARADLVLLAFGKYSCDLSFQFTVGLELLFLFSSLVLLSNWNRYIH